MEPAVLISVDTSQGGRATDPAPDQPSPLLVEIGSLFRAHTTPHRLSCRILPSQKKGGWEGVESIQQTTELLDTDRACLNLLS
jgi:hypothetical protein